MSVVRIACVILNSLGVLALGCADRQAAENSNANAQQNLKNLEAEIGMALPSDAVLINASDGGGRDPSYGFYAWAVFSPSSIKMPPKYKTGKEYINFADLGGIDNEVKFVETVMQKRRIPRPRAAFGSEWENNNYTFRGTLVCASDGDYVAIERFRKK